MSTKKKTAKPTTRGVHLRILKNKGLDSLFLDIVNNGTRKKEYLKLYLTGNRDKDRDTMLIAEQIKARRIRELSLQRAGIEELQLRPEEDFMRFFHEQASRRGKPWQNVKHHLKSFVKGHVRFGDINENWIRGFRNHLADKDLAVNSIATYLDVLKTCFNIAVKQRIISVNPFVYADTVKRQRTVREFLTSEELQLLFNTPCDHDDVRRSFFFACLTGLRISDLRSITMANIREHEIHIKQKKTGDAVSIPLSDQAKVFLATTKNSKPADLVFMFPSRDDVYNRRLQNWVNTAGIKKHITSHSARHTFATLLITAGNDLYSVQHLLGHRDIKVTQIYAKLVDERKRKAIDSLPIFNTR